MLLRTLAAAVATLSAPLLLPAPAHAVGRLTDVQVVDRVTGQTLPTYWHAGRWWVAGTPGNRYGITLNNRSNGRVLTVISVDGVNAVSGETASWDQTGYVLTPWRSTQITGWRKSDSRVAAFEFTALENSYAARTGRPDHVGVIGVAVFRERPRPEPVPLAPAPRRTWPGGMSRSNEAGADAKGAGDAANSAQETGRAESQAPAPSSAAPAESPAAAGRAAESPAAAGRAAESPAAAGRADLRDRMLPDADAPAAEQRRHDAARLGTGHGRHETSRVTYTDFERARAAPDEIVTIHYDSRENLVAMGVIPRSWPLPQPHPHPFPGSALGYVPDPPR